MVTHLLGFLFIMFQHYTSSPSIQRGNWTESPELSSAGALREMSSVLAPLVPACGCCGSSKVEVHHRLVNVDQTLQDIAAYSKDCLLIILRCLWSFDSDVVHEGPAHVQHNVIHEPHHCPEKLSG